MSKVKELEQQLLDKGWTIETDKGMIKLCDNADRPTDVYAEWSNNSEPVIELDHYKYGVRLSDLQLALEYIKEATKNDVV